jgi:hypothetical protein
MQLLAQMIGPDRVLRLPFLIGKPQSRRKSQVAGLLSLAGKNFVPQGVSEQSQDRPFAAAVEESEADVQIGAMFFLT